MIAALAVAAIAIVGLSYVCHRLVNLVDQIDDRADAERHVLMGRIQRPDIFPTAPIRAASPQDTQEPAPAGFEQAGRDTTDLTDEAFYATFGRTRDDD